MSAYRFPQAILQSLLEKFILTLSSGHRQIMNGRLERGLQIAINGGVSEYIEPDGKVSQERFTVASSQSNLPPYTVDLMKQSCDCPDASKGFFCKHRVAAHLIFLALEREKRLDKLVIPPQEQHLPENNAVIWGVVRLNGQFVGVEVVELQGNTATIRALPRIIDGKKLQPQFPFEDKNTTTIPRQELFHVKVFQHAEA